jgi:hypothetical protein
MFRAVSEDAAKQSWGRSPGPAAARPDPVRVTRARRHDDAPEFKFTSVTARGRLLK